jgi:hypothetical protein
MNLLLIVLQFVSIAKPSPYVQALGQEWYDAVATLHENQPIHQQEMEACGCDVVMVQAIMFPEFIRFNGISNLIETEILEEFYVSGGSAAADFSIGQAQIKPSFAEFIETTDPTHTILPPYTSGGETVRRQRLDRLQNFAWQYRYVCAFTKALARRFPELAEAGGPEWVGFLASAYNLGPESSEGAIRDWMQVRAFPHGTRYQGDQFSYTELARWYYQQHTR